MTRLTFSPRARRDLDRLTEFLAPIDTAAADATVDLIVDALLLLELQPRIGRRISHRFRELVIQRGRAGYVALYSVSPDDAEVDVLAIRDQRESGYHDDEL